MTVDVLTCRELVEVVTDYLEGTMSAAERRRFEEHLRSCAGCTAYVDQMRLTIALTGRLADSDVAPPGRELLLHAFREWKRGPG